MGHAEPMTAVSKLDCFRQDPTSFVSTAEKELGAFVAAIRQRFGADAALLAGGYWIEAFEAAIPGSQRSQRDWRGITILAASRVATHMIETPDMASHIPSMTKTH
jgi:hypothetical protein